jgi:hypothetical protein
MWLGTKRMERFAKAHLSPVSKPRHINSIFTVNAPILYIFQYCIYPAIKFLTKKKLFNLIKKKYNGNPIDTSIVVLVSGVA